jgi:circadian clock protein KaiC
VAREVDMMKSRGITGVLTSLTHEGQGEASSVDASSLIDTWLLLRNVESDGERNRLLFVIKSRGTAHSNQVREFVLTDHGAELLDVSLGPRGVLTGSARMSQVAEERAAEAERSAERERRRHALARHSAEIEARIAVLREQLATEATELDRLVAEESRGEDTRAEVWATLARRRQGGRDDLPPAGREA